MTAAEIAAGIESALARIESAGSDLAASRQVDLAGLESEADRLCRALLGLPGAVAKPFAPRLAQMIEALDRLAAGLKAARSATGEATADARRAARAYGGLRG